MHAYIDKVRIDRHIDLDCGSRDRDRDISHRMHTFIHSCAYPRLLSIHRRACPALLACTAVLTQSSPLVHTFIHSYTHPRLLSIHRRACPALLVCTALLTQSLPLVRTYIHSCAYPLLLSIHRMACPALLACTALLTQSLPHVRTFIKSYTHPLLLSIHTRACPAPFYSQLCSLRAPASPSHLHSQLCSSPGLHSQAVALFGTFTTSRHLWALLSVEWGFVRVVACLWYCSCHVVVCVSSD